MDTQIFLTMERKGEKCITNEGYEVEIIEYFNNKNCSIRYEDGVIKEKVSYTNLKNGKIKKPCNRVGEKYITNKGYEVEIIEYFNSKNCTIVFKDDNTIYKNINYTSVKNGSIYKNKCREGRKYVNNNGCTATIIKYIDSYNCTIQFEDGTILEKIRFGSISKGSFTNPFHPSVNGVGFIGIGVHKSSINGNRTKEYSIWADILDRCYSENHREKFPSYIGCSVVEEWHNFQNFAQWYNDNYNPETMQGWHLDKDILVKGNRIYSPETCCLVPQEINGVITKSNKNSKEGQGIRKMGRGFQAEFTKGGKYIHLGIFDTKEEALEMYKIAKENWIKELADRWKGLISDEVYNILINYKYF